MKKDVPSVWGHSQDDAFNTLKRRLTSAPILGYYNPTIPIKLHTDASGVVVGAVLIQRSNDGEVVVAYATKTLDLAQRNNDATQPELYAVVHAIKKFQTYLQEMYRSKLLLIMQLSCPF